LDDRNKTKNNQIAKFGYSGDRNNQIFGYLVIRVTQKPNSIIRVTRITKFAGYSGHPEKSEENQRKLNLVIITQNRLGALPKNGISFEGITIFLAKDIPFFGKAPKRVWAIITKFGFFGFLRMTQITKFGYSGGLFG
jgi:hypothetical protein